MSRRALAGIASAAAVLTLGGVGYSAAARSRNPYYRGPVSEHFDGLRFFLPGTSDRSLVDLLRWRTAGGGTAWPESWPSPFRDRPPERVSSLRVTLIGHASLLVQAAGINILVDPVWSARASPTRLLGPRRVNPPGIVFADLPPIDAVLITHNHYDHLDVATVSRLWHRFRPLVLAPLGNDAIIRAHDDEVEVETLDWGQSREIGGVTAHLSSTNHWSARGINDRRMALWGAWTLTVPDAAPVYLAGDTGYGSGDTFRYVRSQFGAPRLAALPIGAYEPRWFMAAQHMNPVEAVAAMDDLGAKAAIGMHWGTFRLTDETIDRPEADLAAALNAAGVEPERFRAFRPGEVWEEVKA